MPPNLPATASGNVGATTAQGASVTLDFDPPGPQFAISASAEMPAIKAKAVLKNYTPDPKVVAQFQWSVSLAFDGKGVPHSLGKVIADTPEIKGTTSVREFPIKFPKVRGGKLTVNLTVVLGPTKLTAKRDDLTIVGTNPGIPQLAAAGFPDVAMKKITMAESGLKQFLDGQPYFSEDNFGGVGLCQITDYPTNDEHWSWKQNLKKGISIYNNKRTAAGEYAKDVRDGAKLIGNKKFQDLVNAFNEQRKKDKKDPLTITLPDFTEEQLQRDTIRGYNGYATGLHEYRVKLDANGNLVVTANADGKTGKAEWELVTAEIRKKVYQDRKLDEKHWGDPNYVEDVLKKKPSF